MTARVAKDHLKAFVERIERLEEEKKALADDIRDVYAEAKAQGFDTKALRTIVRIRKQDAEERQEQEAILETYLQALGMLDGGRARAVACAAPSMVIRSELAGQTRRSPLGEPRPRPGHLAGEIPPDPGGAVLSIGPPRPPP